MKRKFINIVPECKKCNGKLVLTHIQIDFPNSCYILDIECAVCGEEAVLILSLEDFIDINKLLLKQSEGGQNYDTPNNN
jgi:hypothetical protein